MISVQHGLAWLGSRDSDGLICVSTPEIDGSSLKEMEKYLGVPVFGIG